MCGIAGSLGVCDEGEIGRMVDALAARGPDDGGVVLAPEIPAALGHRRLSIIDLSDAAHQPMSTGDGRYTLVYNGEIYNYRELARDLRAAGVTTTGGGDTHVLLEALRLWGLDALPRLRGMFAFAWLDRGPAHGRGASVPSRLGRPPYLLLARDRLGIKPLVYGRTRGAFYFASELRALRSSSLGDTAQLDPAAVVEYLTHGAVRQPRTILSGVKQLAPGAAMVVSQGGRATATERYWDPWHSEDAYARRRALATVDLPDLVAMVRDGLRDAARAHMVADVEVGAFLSGGVDSAAVVALMREATGRPPRTFTVGFETPTGEVEDERAPAAHIASHLGCEHHEVVIAERAVPGHVQRVVERLDQPSVDGTNTFLVAEAAARHVKVAMSGLGGDELFAGYPHFVGRARRPVPAPFGAQVAALQRFAPLRALAPLLARMGDDAIGLELARRQTSGVRLRQMLAPDLHRLLGEDPLASAVNRDYLGADSLTLMSLFELRGYLLSTLLRDVDVMSMSHSLEVRPLLLDHPLVELALALPPHAKVGGGLRKVVLRQAIQGLLPPGVVATRQKLGFELPLATWLNGPLRTSVRDVLSSGSLTRFLAPRFLAAMSRRAHAGSLRRKDWTWFVLGAWLRAEPGL